MPEQPHHSDPCLSEELSLRLGNIQTIEGWLRREVEEAMRLCQADDDLHTCLARLLSGLDF
jgi:hypothetical protein